MDLSYQTFLSNILMSLNFSSIGNVLKEIVEPAGAIIRTKDFILGDPTISVLELWGAEYQESDAILIRPESIPVLKKISAREKAPVCFVGTITGKAIGCIIIIPYLMLNIV